VAEAVEAEAVVATLAVIQEELQAVQLVVTLVDKVQDILTHKTIRVLTHTTTLLDHS
jgi:hypothetical protein